MGNATPQEAISNYLTDMLSLERHIDKAIESQLSDLKKYPEVIRELEQIHSTVEFHISSLEGVANNRGGGQGPADMLKKAGSAVLGAAAGVIDLVRTEGLPKNLRDDYTAFSLATISYTMLHTTALALGDNEVATLAHRHLADYARVVMTLHNIIPVAVVQFLKEDGMPVNQTVLAQVARNIDEVWTSQSGSVRNADERTISKR
jgi:ferritin-like metal-binding protein YciE